MNKILLLTNVFPKILNPKPLIILITKMRGLTHFLSNLLPIHGFLIGGEKLQTSFPNWFQEWWLFLGAIPNIFCPDVQKYFDYFKANSESFFPSRNNYSLSFYSQFGIHLILCWDFTTHNLLPSLFPQHLAIEFKIKWWAAFKISRTQTFESIKDWIDSKKSKPKISSKKTPIWSSPLLGPLSWPQTPSKTSFPSNSTYNAYLKKV